MSVIVQPMLDDPFLFDLEALESASAPGVVGEGLRCFKEHRVIAFDQAGDCLWGEVEDESLDPTVHVAIELVAADALRLSCDCDISLNSVCCHQIAVLYAYADQKHASGQLLSATENAVKERMKRGRSEVAVEHLSGMPWFGLWTAASVSTETHFPRQYQVSVRSLERRINVCNCPDFQVNQLGTCKHIEAVLHKIGKRDDYQTIKHEPAPVSYVFLAWDLDDAPALCLHRSRELSAELKNFLDSYFAANGRFIGRLPDDFFRFAELAEGRSDVHIGDDALEYARQLASDAAHQLRAQRIHSQIAASNGRLPGIKARLYPYQIDGVAFLAGTGRALLADDMGLGKTLQAIAAASWLQQREGVRKILVICPASLKQQWAREIARFTDLGVQMIEGPAAERGVQYRRDATFFILNYELVLRDLSLLKDSLNPDLIIMDEAQRIKNWRTKIAAAVKLIPCRYAFVLSGTPLENRLEDLYSLMQVVNPRVLGPLWRYLVDFHVTDARGKVLGYRNLSLLRRRLAPVLLRRDRRLVRDQLPDRIDQRLDVTMTPKQIELHDSAMNNAGRLAHIARKRPLTPTEQNRLLAALQQARMACNAAGLVDKESSGSPKLDELVDILDELCVQSGLKAVVFSQWEIMTQMVESRLLQMGLGCVRLHGGVPTAKRGALIDRFRDDDSIQVFLSTDAGGVGLNLQSGAVLVHLDVPWNPAVLEQRTARIHRLGQTRTVQIITMVAANSYEEQVFSLVRNKQHLFNNVIGQDATEDVVGVSKKLLETLIDNLTPSSAPSSEQEQEQEGGGVPVGEETAAPGAKTGVQREASDANLEQELTRCIQTLQTHFGARIERIIGSGGGLLVVLDRVDYEADQVAEQLSQHVPVALVDGFALKGLQRLGGSVLAEAETLFAADNHRPAGESSKLQRQADEKIRAAGLLLEQHMTDSALDLLVGALLCAAAERAGRDVAFTREEVSVWAYADALPQELLSHDEVGLLMRALGFAQGSHVPGQLVTGLFEDAGPFVAGCDRGADASRFLL